MLFIFLAYLSVNFSLSILSFEFIFSLFPLLLSLLWVEHCPFLFPTELKVEKVFSLIFGWTKVSYDICVIAVARQWCYGFCGRFDT